MRIAMLVLCVMLCSCVERVAAPPPPELKLINGEPYFSKPEPDSMVTLRVGSADTKLIAVRLHNVLVDSVGSQPVRLTYDNANLVSISASILKNRTENEMSYVLTFNSLAKVGEANIELIYQKDPTKRAKLRVRVEEAKK